MQLQETSYAVVLFPISVAGPTIPSIIMIARFVLKCMMITIAKCTYPNTLTNLIPPVANVK